MVCRTCYDRLSHCPLCKTPKGNYIGKVINVASCAIARRDEVLSNFGVTSDEIEAAANAGRRPGDVSDREYAEQRNREAIQQALRDTDETDTDDDDVVPLQQFSQSSQSSRLRLGLSRNSSNNRVVNYVSSSDDD